MENSAAEHLHLFDIALLVSPGDPPPGHPLAFKKLTARFVMPRFYRLRTKWRPKRTERVGVDHDLGDVSTGCCVSAEVLRPTTPA